MGYKNQRPPVHVLERALYYDSAKGSTWTAQRPSTLATVAHPWEDILPPRCFTARDFFRKAKYIFLASAGALGSSSRRLSLSFPCKRLHGFSALTAFTAALSAITWSQRSAYSAFTALTLRSRVFRAHGRVQSALTRSPRSRCSHCVHGRVLSRARDPFLNLSNAYVLLK